MPPGALVFQGSSREREPLSGADTMLLFALGVASAILVSDFRSPQCGYRPVRWRVPCAQTSCSPRNNARITSHFNARSHATSAVDETV